MRTINDLVNFMNDKCYQKFTLTSDGTELQLNNGFGLKCTKETFEIGYNERGNKQSIEKFKTETEAVVAFYKRIKSNKLLRRHCIGVLKSKESFTELTAILKSNHIRFEQDSILYAENDTRYRVFVFGCDVKRIDDLKNTPVKTSIPWTDNKILLSYSEYTPCKIIFQAVCDEIGKNYSEKGYRYSRSGPKITIENEKIKLEINFWSSGSNMPGQSVNLKILPSFYSKQLKQSKIDGFLFGHTGIFYHKYLDNSKKTIVNTIFGETFERTTEHTNESNIIDGHNCNVYGLQKENFEKILNFIDTKIIVWFEKIQNKNGILELTENASKMRLWTLNGKESNSDFVPYVKLNFPDVEIDNILEK
ncbi:hypothetical protein H0I23_01410 [Cellulophaga sp. HaHaR_3_176]|uniref:hypothetical protein n=1 Tax=Cellulophaga sp. HaHaR_3_176 TaxID=1942464 RepID=UPI001C1F238F|nr:hypothetical protein [Cellulophaga sp. HaHaR_3_176]QWX84340.1 hypothetical protein H0I23_01410 [Cellulophaga sp. HaHaR_3_176]